MSSVDSIADSIATNSSGEQQVVPKKRATVQDKNRLMKELEPTIAFYKELDERSHENPLFLNRTLNYAKKSSQEGTSKEASNEQSNRRRRSFQFSNLQKNSAHKGGNELSLGGASSSRGKGKDKDKDRDRDSNNEEYSSKFRMKIVVSLHYSSEDGREEWTDERNDLNCPWCSVQCKSWDPYWKHITSSHERFKFEHFPDYSERVERHHLRVIVRKDVQGTELEFAHENESKKRKAPAPTKEEIAAETEKIMNKPKKSQKGSRQYHHSQTYLPILPSDPHIDSDDEADERWLLLQRQNLIDEFEDVTLKEKAFMKLWNEFVHYNAIPADFFLPRACYLFVHRYRSKLLENDLRTELLMHLITLFNFNLLRPEAITTCISLLDGVLAQPPTPSLSEIDFNHHLRDKKGVVSAAVAAPPVPLAAAAAEENNSSAAAAAASTPSSAAKAGKGRPRSRSVGGSSSSSSKNQAAAAAIDVGDDSPSNQ